MGVFEFEKFAKGTFGVAETLAELSGKVMLLLTASELHVPALERAVLLHGDFTCVYGAVDSQGFGVRAGGCVGTFDGLAVLCGSLAWQSELV